MAGTKGTCEPALVNQSDNSQPPTKPSSFSAGGRRQAARSTDQRSHVQVPRLVRRDRHDQLIVLPVEFDMDPLVGVGASLRCRRIADGMQRPGAYRMVRLLALTAGRLLPP